MNGLIRIAELADVPGLGAIERAAGRLFPASRIPDPDGSYPIPLLEAAVAAGLLFVAEMDASVVGFAACRETGPRLHLDELSVHPDHGRQGLGRRLVEKVIAASARRELTGVSLTTFSDIAWNGPFYASMGFETLSDSDLDEALAEMLRHEGDMGLINRIAMFRPGDRG